MKERYIQIDGAGTYMEVPFFPESSTDPLVAGMWILGKELCSSHTCNLDLST
jgi:hypothetical protein